MKRQRYHGRIAIFAMLTLGMTAAYQGLTGGLSRAALAQPVVEHASPAQDQGRPAAADGADMDQSSASQTSPAADRIATDGADTQQAGGADAPAGQAPTPSDQPAAPLQTQGCVNPPPNMVDWWTFDEAAGPIADDTGGNIVNAGNFGAGLASPVPAPGFVANALKFDGNDFVTVPDHPEIDFPSHPYFCSAFGIDAWIKTSQGTGTVVLLDKRANPSAPVGYSVYLYNGRLGLQLADGLPAGSICGAEGVYPCTNYTAPMSSVNIADNQWHLIAVTVQVHGSKTFCPEEGKLYVDGGLVHQFTPRTHSLGNGNLPGSSIANSAELNIGRRAPAFGSGGSFKGLIDELEFFHSSPGAALTQAEIMSLVSAGTAGKCK